MTAVVPDGRVVWGLQLPVQSTSSRYVERWEHDAAADELAQVARAADRAGAFYVAVCDHLAIPESEVASMGATWWHTLTTLGWLAGVTERARLLSHVYVPAYRHVLEVAKGFGTLDHLSGGRAILGVGVGHVEAEFETLGVPLRRRGHLLDEALDELRALWADAPEPGRHRGSAGTMVVAPAPRRPGGPPVWVGGSSAAARRRAVERGDGWLPQGPPPEGMRAAVAELREWRAAVRPDDALDVGAHAPAMHIGEAPFELGAHDRDGSPEEHAELLRRIVSVGADHVQVRFRARSAAELCEQLEAFGTEVWPLVEAAGR